MLLIHHVVFEGGGGTDDVLGAGSILHTGQLNHDTLITLLLDHRFCHTEFVDPFAQGSDVLLDGEFLNALHVPVISGMFVAE